MTTAASPAGGTRLRAFLRTPRGRAVAVGVLVLGVLYLRSRSSSSGQVVTADGTTDGTGSSSTPADAGGAIDTGGAAVLSGSDFTGAAPVDTGTFDTTSAYDIAAAAAQAAIAGVDPSAWGWLAPGAGEQPGGPATGVTAPGPSGAAPATANAPVTTRGVWWNGVYLSSLSDLQAYRAKIGAPGATLQTFLYQHPGLASAIGVPTPAAPGPVASQAGVKAPGVLVSAPVVRLPALTPKQVQTQPGPTASYVVPASPGVPQQVVTVPVVAPPPINVSVKPNSAYIPAAVTHGRGLGGPQA